MEELDYTNSKIQPALKDISSSHFNLLDQIPSITFFLCNPRSGQITNVSEPVFELSGHSSTEFLEGGISFFMALLHPQDYRQILRSYLQLMELHTTPEKDPEKMCQSFPMRIKHKRGHWLQIEITLLMLEYSGSGLIEQTMGLIKKNSNGFPMGSGYTKITRFNSNALTTQLGLNLNGVRELSRREKQILKLIAHGHTSQDIALRLSLSPHTVVTHRQNLIAKFKVKNTAELVLYASRMFWL